MAQMTIYLPDNLEKQARKAAKAKGKSVSRWIADQVADRLQSSWPQAVLDAAGVAPDFPSAEELRKGYAKDVPRKSLS